MGRREVALALMLAPLATCLPGTRPDKDIAFLSGKKGGKLPPDDPKRLVELIDLDPSLILDMRYATRNNFTNRTLYPEARAFMAAPAAAALVRAHASAKHDGYGFTIFDAYRPWTVTKTLWNATPRALRNYVANPKRGSRHNRGCAVDMTMHDLKTGQLVEMPSGFDDFSERAHRDFVDTTPIAIANRDRLQHYMEAAGFIGLSNEWWHFDFSGWEDFPVMDVPFGQIV